MSCRIEKRFAELRARQRKGLIPFITAGDPLPNASVAIMHALVDYGADLIELGVPYSDPVADGPTIQHSSERAIARGVGIEQILGWVREFRERDVDTPIVLMGYLNPLEIYGYRRFATEARDVGVDGVLLQGALLGDEVAYRSHAPAAVRLVAQAVGQSGPAEATQPAARLVPCEAGLALCALALQAREFAEV